MNEFYKTGALSYDDWLCGIYNGHSGAASSYESYKNIFKLIIPPKKDVEEVWDEYGFKFHAGEMIVRKTENDEILEERVLGDDE